MASKKGPKSPHSNKELADVDGRELDAWVAQEIDGYNGVSRRPDGDYDGNKGGMRLVPNYRNPSAVKALAGNVLTSGRRLVLNDSGKGFLDIDSASEDECALANKVLVLESMFKRGAVTQ